MQIGKKGFPYPVINNAKNYNSFVDSSYALKYDYAEDANNFILNNVRLETNNEQLKYLITCGKARAMIMIECSSTIFKHSEEISLIPKDISIPIGNLCGRVEISSMVYATDNIFNYGSDDFNEDYSGYRFTIEKYCPIAVDDGDIAKIDYDDLADKKVSSIFSVVKSFNPDLKIMNVINDDKKIKIELPEQEFQKFDSLNGQSIFYNIFFSIIIIPALSSCLKDLQVEMEYQNKTLEDIVDSHSWFLSIESAYKKLYNVELSDEIFREIDVLELAQFLMESCVVNSIDDFFDIITRKTDNAEEED